MSDRVTSYAKKAENYAPWSNEVPWYWILIEGAAGVLLGLYFVFSPDAASSTVRYLIAAVLIGSSAFDILNGFRNSRNIGSMMSPMTPYWLVRGGAGLAIGIIAVIAEHSDAVSDADARKLIGYGLLAWGVIGLIGNLDALFSSNFTWMGMLGNALALLIGAALIYNNQEAVAQDKATKYVGWAALIGGLIMLAYAYFVRRGQDEEVATTQTLPTVDSVSAAAQTLPNAAPKMPADAASIGTALPKAPTIDTPEIPRVPRSDGQ